jgi:UDP-glucose 4-epimerase
MPKLFKNILITGGAGFIGSNLADKLLQENYNVVVVDNLSAGKKENLDKKVKFYKMDIGDKKISKVFAKERPDIVFHLAAQINVRDSVKDPIADAKANILGSLNILESCKNYNVKKIIFSSSGGTIYGSASIIPTPESSPEIPESPYGIAKLSVEKYLNYYHKGFGLEFIALRFANVYGPRQNPKGEAGVVAIFTDKMLAKKEVVINGSGKQTRDYVFVDDVVSACILSMKSDKIGIFNVGTGMETDVNFIFAEIKRLTNSDCMEAHGQENIGELQRSCLDFAKIKNSFIWTPKYDFKIGLEKTVIWFKNKK